MGLIMFGVGLFADYLDGFIARALNVSSDVGKELDSLGDLISFGFFPSVVLYIILNDYSTGFFPYLAFILAAFSGYRLAKFNLDTRQSEDFLGMPTPSVAMFVIGIFFIWQEGKLPFADTGFIQYILLGVILILSYLLMSEIPMFSMKFKGFGFKKNIIRYSFIIFFLAMLPFFGKFSIAYLFIGYLGHNISKHLMKH